MAQNVVSISASGVRTEISAITAIGFTPIDKGGDSGIGNLSMTKGTITDGRLVIVGNNQWTIGDGLGGSAKDGSFGLVNDSVTAIPCFKFTSAGDAAFTGSVTILSGSPTFNIKTTNAGTYASPQGRYLQFQNYLGSSTASIVADDMSASNAATRLNFYVKNTAGTASAYLILDGYNQISVFSTPVEVTTVKVTSAGGYISSDNSTGITTTVTTASLVGKTITIKDGIITGFA